MKKLTGVLIIGSPSRNIRISYLDEVDNTGNTQVIYKLCRALNRVSHLVTVLYLYLFKCMVLFYINYQVI
jgi:hypothetical protein